MEQEWSWVFWIVVILAAFVVIRGTVRFDVMSTSGCGTEGKKGKLYTCLPKTD